MIEVGKKYCPVCVANNGVGDSPLKDGSHMYPSGKDIQPCRYPWQTPIGVLLEEPRQVGQTKPAEIMIRGKFELYFYHDTPAPTTKPDIVGIDVTTSMIGMRVYYEAESGYYIPTFATCPNISSEIANEYWGKYPGSATVGYISAMRQDGNRNAGWVTITIDPRPALATYSLANCDSPTSIIVGDPVTIKWPENTVVRYLVSGSKTCDGVAASILYDEDDHPYHVIVCRSGPAWVFPYAEDLLARMPSDISRLSPDNVPIDVLLQLRPSNDHIPSTDPRLGYAYIRSWEELGSGDVTCHMIIDVNIGHTTEET